MKPNEHPLLEHASQDKITVITDRKWKQFKYRDEVPAKVLADTLDWTTEEDHDGYFKYRRWWYHIGDFVCAVDPLAKLGWHGQHGNNFFSGIVLRVSADGEEYQVGRYLS